MKDEKEDMMGDEEVIDIDDMTDEDLEQMLKKKDTKMVSKTLKQILKKLSTMLNYKKMNVLMPKKKDILTV